MFFGSILLHVWRFTWFLKSTINTLRISSVNYTFHLIYVFRFICFWGFLLENLRRLYGFLDQFCFIYEGLHDSWNLINTLVINGFPLYITRLSLFVRFSFFGFGVFSWILKKGLFLGSILLHYMIRGIYNQYPSFKTLCGFPLYIHICPYLCAQLSFSWGFFLKLEEGFYVFCF